MKLMTVGHARFDAWDVAEGYGAAHSQPYPAISTVNAAEREMIGREMLLPMMVANLKEYLDAAKARVGIGYRLTDRCAKSIAEYDDAAKEIDFDQGFAIYLSLPKAENFGSQSVQAFIDQVFRHELHHSQGLDEAAARNADIDHFRWESHRSEARLRECVMVLNVLQNQTIGIEVDASYLRSWHVLLPALTNYALGEKLAGGAEGRLIFMVVDSFMRSLGYGGGGSAP
jgi:hypothetical protein